MTAAGLSIFATVCAFLMGFSVNQGSTCAVTAAKQLVHERHATMLTGFAIAIGAAGLICLPLGWLLGDTAQLARDAGFSGVLIAGALMLALGAVINDACLFGTLSRIGHGEVRFLALPIGLALGFALADRQTLLRAAPTLPNALTIPSAPGFLAVAGFGLLLVAGWYRLGRGEDVVRHRDWPLRHAMLILGICGALLFTLAPGWTYADAVRRGVAPGAAMAMIGIGALLAACAALAGALASGLRARAFVFRRPSLIAIARSVVGGMVMAFGATLIPGGNDTLLLSTVPALTVSGIAAYAIMSAAAPLFLLAERRLIVTARGRSAKQKP